MKPSTNFMGWSSIILALIFCVIAIIRGLQGNSVWLVVTVVIVLLGVHIHYTNKNEAEFNESEEAS